MIAVRAIEVFRAGDRLSSRGELSQTTPNDLRAIAAAYNNHGQAKAPLFLGHPDRTKPRPQGLGSVLALHVHKDSLFALVEVEGRLLDLVKRGLYRYVSAGFLDASNSRNPAPGVMFLDHVAILGANPPAVWGMQPLEFREDGAAAVTWEVPLTVDFADGHAGVVDHSTAWCAAFAGAQGIPGTHMNDQIGLSDLAARRMGFKK